MLHILRLTLPILLGFNLLLSNEPHAQESDYNCKAILHNYSNATVTLISAKDIAAGQRNPAYCKVRGTITLILVLKYTCPMIGMSAFIWLVTKGLAARSMSAI